jgi:glutamate synthase domain-containing protein 2/glutamate synthase domain-containing protein 1/glutamate synthase domain-containing protein 3
MGKSAKVGLPAKQGLYDPQFEKDACGVGFVANINGTKSHAIIEKGIQILINLEHRGATGSDAKTGDGAGILIQLPHQFLVKVALETGVGQLPAEGRYGVGAIFLPKNVEQAEALEVLIEETVKNEGFVWLGWRTVPTDNHDIGALARESEPLVKQFFITLSEYVNDQSNAEKLERENLNRRLFVLRKVIEKQVRLAQLQGKEQCYLSSLSCYTLIYKGLLTANQIPAFYPDLQDPDMLSAMALVHQRYSTNTFPTWDRAHPYRFIAHNGEINTMQGNINWMKAREAMFESDVLAVSQLSPVIVPGNSDSGSFDNVLELLVMAGRDISHAMMMMIPEAWETQPDIDLNKKAFYEYHQSLIEPWDGPAAIAFTDGKVIGATLDRNGLRPARWLVTKDGLVVLASETGVLDIPIEQVERKGRLEPGKMFLVDLEEGRIVADEELKKRITARQPYGQWLAENKIRLRDLPPPPDYYRLDWHNSQSLVRRQQAFGYTSEELRVLVQPMAQTGEEAVGSMGDDTPIAVLSEKPQVLYNYFKQMFAQVTNPPIDPIREELVMSLSAAVGTEQNLLSESPLHCRQLQFEQPILTNYELEHIRHIDRPGFKCRTLPMLFNPENGEKGLKEALDELCWSASEAILQDYNIIILSDRGVSAGLAPIPALLATAAVHHFLIRKSLRTRCGLITESGEPREVMHFALLVGYGASAVNPYLAFESIQEMQKQGIFGEDYEYKKLEKNYIKAIDKGLLKIFSKMGISTFQSYQGAQIFEAIGLSPDLVEKYFVNTPSRIGGIGLNGLVKQVRYHHERAFDRTHPDNTNLIRGGKYQWRKDGEHHHFSPAIVAKLQHSVMMNDFKQYKQFSATVNAADEKQATLRGLLKFKKGNPLPLEEVEPIENILRRFCTGAMSFGSISKEAHETLAIAMNRIGGKSNTGEGGEDPARYEREANGDWKRSAIKQVASGRFGVTSHYLVNADEIQIKMAQGAKPGEGGQLPGHKVDENIARVRNAVPGVTLISPPPHHDIYSIEDLAQLIWDLKNVNPKADVSVKLVAEVGVGTVAAGVAKAHADAILISGHDGGTGASPLTSIKHAGIPWEIGLAETQQVLLLNDLRSRVRLQTDGQLKTGRDVVIATLLGAEEYGFATAALVTLGCVLMRKCHLNTCPVGIATQDPRLRAKFLGKPEFVVNYFKFIAQEVREFMAELGFRTIDEMVGRSDMLDVDVAVQRFKERGLDLSTILYTPQVPAEVKPFNCDKQDHALHKALDNKLIELCRPALEDGAMVELALEVRNLHRSVGAMLGGEVSRRYGAAGLPENTIQITFRGSGGQSFGAFLPRGITFILEGDTNDYTGKGLSGGRLVVKTPVGATFDPRQNIIVGNTTMYGAITGEAYFNGVAGERFCVRNSGASAVVEGVGDHGCEYMTGGRVVVLGKTGVNFAAGMSGGIAFVLDEDGKFIQRCNMSMVDVEAIADADDERELRSLIKRHYSYTGSAIAEQILLNWAEYLSNFVKVMPHEYRRALAQRHSLATLPVVKPNPNNVEVGKRTKIVTIDEHKYF